MSGHSKWANIKRDKAANDAKKSSVFTKVSRLITVAARQGGGDPDSNSALRLAIEKAKYNRMPKENIEKAIKKGLGVGEGQGNYEETVYEGYGPLGVAFYIKAITDNKNRTVSEIRNIFSRYGGSLGGAGSTLYIFAADAQNPIFTVSADEDNMQKLIDLKQALEDHDDVQEVYENIQK